jgi:hypothetical protein
MSSLCDYLPMKLTFIFLLISYFSLGQKWSYQGHDKTKKFGHEYWFSFQNEEDTGTYSYSYSENINSSNINISVLNKEGEQLIFTQIVLKNLVNDSLINLMTDINGNISTNLAIGKHSLIVRHMGYDLLEKDIKIVADSNLMITTTLGLGSELTVYQINSKRKLSDEKVESIIDCVKNGNRNYPSFGCERKRKYNITMHI